MIRPLLLALVATACAPEVASCRTHCGAFVESDGPPVFSCEDYRALELVLADELSRKVPDACSAWQGLRLRELPGDKSPFGTVPDGAGGVRTQYVGGWTDCPSGVIEFHTHDGAEISPGVPRRPWNTALPHELIHGAQRCVARLPVDPGADADHANWFRDRFFDLPAVVAGRLAGRAP